MAELFAKYNGIIDRDTVGIDPYRLNNVLGFCEDIQSRLNSKRPDIPGAPEVRICVINNPLVDGTVEKRGSIYYIGIFFGTFFVFENLFMRMVANPNLFKSHGNVESEVEHDKVIEIRTDSYEHVYDIMGEVIYPNDHDRGRLANELMTLCLNFLVYHEYAHVTHGHVDYSLSSDFPFSLNEKGTEELEELNYDPTFRQICEIEADRSANYETILALEVLIATKQPYFQKLYPNLNEALYLYVFSVYSFFKIIEGPQTKKFNRHRATHPSKSIRRNILLEMVSNYFGAKFKDSPTLEADIKNIGSIFNKAINHVEDAFEAITQQTFDGDFKLHNDEITEYLSFIYPQMKDVRTKLTPFTFDLTRR